MSDKRRRAVQLPRTKYAASIETDGGYWLGPDLLWDEFPWEMGVKTDMPTFLAKYTLHDSGWVGVFIEPDAQGLAVVVIRWDTFWTDGRVPFPGSAVAEWPFLLIRLSEFQGIELIDFRRDPSSPRTISGTSCDPVSHELHITKIEDVYGGTVVLKHGPSLDILCLSPNKTAHSIVGLS